ncbi:membrane protein of unknown function [Methylorubrum extorquens]|uniref:Uncharacterized protein n=1 Tax=Methylorubrum extorquens TaxID=408 RepID=A0A2N9APL1_METEX|nr:membrane protein of unknown function [Methylorubrum extorquens]
MLTLRAYSFSQVSRSDRQYALRIALNYCDDVSERTSGRNKSVPASPVDRIAEWMSVGSRRTVLKSIYVIGIILSPIWVSLFVYFTMNYGFIDAVGLDLIYTPVFIGTVGCLILPIKSVILRILIAVAYGPTSLVLLLAFHLSVGCMLIGFCV